jgi:hypothetical protein
MPRLQEEGWQTQRQRNRQKNRQDKRKKNYRIADPISPKAELPLARMLRNKAPRAARSSRAIDEIFPK